MSQTVDGIESRRFKLTSVGGAFSASLVASRRWESIVTSERAADAVGDGKGMLGEVGGEGDPQSLSRATSPGIDRIPLPWSKKRNLTSYLSRHQRKGREQQVNIRGNQRNESESSGTAERTPDREHRRLLQTMLSKSECNIRRHSNQPKTRRTFASLASMLV